jgi:uncharacterized protein YndB with AHSA1/START domain
MNAGNTLVLKRTFPASCERLFSMWTSAEKMMTWFCPGEHAERRVRESGAERETHFQLEVGRL